MRFATPVDVEAIVGLAQDLIAESPRFRRSSPSTPKIRLVAQFAIERPEGCAIVAERDGVIVGCMIAFVSELFFGFDRIVSDAIVYVAPRYRRSPVFARMMRLLEQWAAEQAADEIMLGISSQIAPEKTVGAYRKMGYELTTYTLSKDLRDV